MAGFADLVAKAQPALYGGGLAASAGEGAKWEWPFVDIVDNNGDDIDLTSGVTATCTVYDAETNATVISPTVTLGVGTLTVVATAANTAGKAASADEGGRQCRWSLKLAHTSAGTIYAWGRWNSNFVILDEDGA
jgi:hypothetical protein